MLVCDVSVGRLCGFHTGYLQHKTTAAPWWLRFPVSPLSHFTLDPVFEQRQKQTDRAPTPAVALHGFVWSVCWLWSSLPLSNVHPVLCSSCKFWLCMGAQQDRIPCTAANTVCTFYPEIPLSLSTLWRLVGCGSTLDISSTNPLNHWYRGDCVGEFL